MALTKTTGGVQIMLTLFVIVFPVLIASAFFLLLWFRPDHLYAPSNAMHKTLNTLTHIPDDRVEEIIEDFKSEGATVSKHRDPAGTWSVTGTFGPA